MTVEICGKVTLLNSGPTICEHGTGKITPVAVGDSVRIHMWDRGLGWIEYTAPHGGYSSSQARGVYRTLDSTLSVGFNWDEVTHVRPRQVLPELKVELNEPLTTAPDLLNQAAKHMADRAATYDKPEGERSMASTVKAFNTITGRELKEADGWLLLTLLKFVRDNQRQQPHRDSVEDAIAYAALYGEARLQEGGEA